MLLLFSVELLLNCGSPGVLVFLMGFWNSSKGFSGLCTVKWMTAWEQRVGCETLLGVSLLSLSLTWQKSLFLIFCNFLSVAKGKPFLPVFFPVFFCFFFFLIKYASLELNTHSATVGRKEMEFQKVWRVSSVLLGKEWEYQWLRTLNFKLKFY